TTIGQGRSTTVYTGNDIKNVLSGNLIETVSLLRSTQAKDIFKYAANQIELEVGEQTSITMDNGKILLRFGKSTILMNGEGIWLDGKHIGLQETKLDLPRNPLSDLNNPLEYSHYFVLVDPDSQQPLSNVPYIVRGENNLEIRGRTDREGRTEDIITTLKPQQLNFYAEMEDENNNDER
ncbi:hypothetical protein HYE59_08990, partial [Aggregatibacter actinomycetemcomitans]|uniref:hypothetical protein n=1 Tax=Aggregatibacter actinomycetemcomitans TaxID=714 RepID=UPI00197BF2D9